MNRTVKIKKLLISIFVILIFAIICSSNVKGATITKKDGTTYEVEDEYLIFSDYPEVNQNFDTFYANYAGAGNALLFCINHSAGYFGTLSKAEYETYKPDGTTYFEYCELDEEHDEIPIKKEATDDKEELLYGAGTYMKYTFREKVNDKIYQDAMHIFYEAMHNTTIEGKNEGQYFAPVVKDDNNNVIVSANDFSKAIWSTYLNIGKKEDPNNIGNEGREFKKFYKYIHGIPLYDSNDPEIHNILGYNPNDPNDPNYPEGQNPDHQEIYESRLNYDSYSDIFANLIKNNTNVDNIIVEVNQEEGYYIVGPFNITYPNTYVNNKNKFSWINCIQAVTETEAGEDIKNTKILDTNKSEITIDRIQKDGDYNLNGQDFYIKFYSTSAINLKLKVDFGYIESYDGEVVTYDGISRVRYWKERQITDNCVRDVHNDKAVHEYVHDDHGYDPSHYEGYHGYRKDANGNLVAVPCDDTCLIECDCKKTGKRIGYEIIDEDNKDKKDNKIVTQRIAHVVSVETNIKGTSIEIGIPNDDDEDKIDLTMKIAGNVFLDAFEGKANDVNNLFDNGEGLSGITVILHNADGSFAYKDGKIVSTITNRNGYYEFDGLNAQNKYYVEYLYNGMLYTNVKCISNIEENFPNRSKATETSQGPGNNRTNFNKIFQEIGSYPANYYSPSGDFWNRTYSQDEIADVFIKLERLILENKVATKKEVFDQLKNEFGESKAAFAIDCMISAYSEKTYPLAPHFYIEEIIEGDDPDKLPALLYSENYSPYENNKYPETGGNIKENGKYNQLHVNLGIKARSTIDLQLMKSVSEIEVGINGKNENYKYDPSTQTLAPSVGIREEDYLNGMVGKYKGSNGFVDFTIPKNQFVNNTLEFNMRTEEIINGNAIGHDGHSYTGYESNDYLNKNKQEKDKLIEGKDNKYAVANNGKQLQEKDKLKIYITYRLDITNTSTVSGAVTEIVDYYDPNLKVVDAYIGNSIGVKEGNVNIANTSRYGTNTEYKNDNAYKTMYLIPDEKWLDFSQEQYIYVKFELLGTTENDAATLLAKKLKDDKDTLISMNVAEINGYKTNEGVIDIDSTPGNLDISGISKLQHKDNLERYPYEDDTSKAPAIVFKLTVSRSIEGTVFEDKPTEKDGFEENAVNTGKERIGNGTFDKGEKGIAGVKVELIEIKNGEMIPRAETYTNANGWYGFTGFIPGDYTIKYTYGEEDYTAMTTKSQYYQGSNDTSYNGQDYQSTIYRSNTPITTSPINIKGTIIDNFPVSGSYWYDRDTTRYSDARDDVARVNEVKAYSNGEYGVQITNHKAEVFSAYVNPQQKHIDDQYNRNLADELEQRTHRYAYTPLMEIEVEYAKTTWESGTHGTEHKIQNVDFGIIQRPKEELLIDQDVVHVKITSAKGEKLIDVTYDTRNADDVKNLQWVERGASNEKDWRGEFSDWAKELLKGTKLSEYEKEELVNAIVDEEVINGAQLEIEYNIQVRNNAELGNGNTRAKRIVNYVSNNLTFDEENNRDSAGRPLWKVVPRESIQNGEKSTLINNTGVDLSTQSVILEATDCNPLITKSLAPNGQTETVKLVLKKVLSTEGGSTGEDFIFTNMTEIVEIENDEGRYDHGAIPGNQDLTLQPQEHDTSGASRYADHGDTLHPQDGTVVVGPPYGSNYNYYTYLIIGITLAGVILVGVILIKKFVINKQ